jgi:hypothetical protein
MRRSRTIILLSLFTALLMLIAGVAQAANPKYHPVRERIEGSLVSEPVLAPEGRCSQPALLISFHGEGILTGVGKVDFTTTHCSYLTPDFQLAGRYGEADMVMMTRSGDEIYATYEGYQIDEDHYLEHLQVTGGSGKYSGTTGTLVEIVTVDLTNFDVSIRGWGWILR